MKKIIIYGLLIAAISLTGCSKSDEGNIEDAANINFEAIEDTTEGGIATVSPFDVVNTNDDRESVSKEPETETDGVTKKIVPNVLKDLHVEAEEDGRPPFDFKDYITGDVDFSGMKVTYDTDRSVNEAEVQTAAIKDLFYYFGAAYDYKDLSDDIVRRMTSNEYQTVKGYKQHLAEGIVEAKAMSAFENVFNQALLYMAETAGVEDFQADVVEYDANYYYNDDYALANLVGWSETYLNQVRDDEKEKAYIDEMVLTKVTDNLTNEIAADFILDYYDSEMTDQDYQDCLDSMIKENGRRYTNQFVRHYGKQQIRLIAKIRKAAKLILKDESVIINE